MKLVRCNKGHYYDGDKFQTCPHCQSETGDDNLTVALSSGAAESSAANVTQMQEAEAPKEITPTMSIKDAVNLNETVTTADDEDDVKTVRLGSMNKEQDEPVVGWLVGLNGEVYGKSFVVKTGKNFIGRGADMDIVIKGDNAVSREKHAILIFEPKAKVFIAQPGESRELFYINDEVVLNNVQMKKNDVICLGNTKLMLIPCVDDAFNWDDVKEN